MHPSTFGDALRKLCNAQPFVPFAVELVSGEQLYVRSPGDISTTYNGLAVYVSDGGRRHFFDGTSVCRLFEAPVDPDFQLSLEDLP